MDETIVVDESRVEGDAVSIERDRGELEVQGVVMPLVVTHLGVQSEGKGPLSYLLSKELAPTLLHILGTEQSFTFPGLAAGLPTQLKQ